MRKKAQLYKHNVLLVPHGDDFRYQSQSEWDKQLGNMAKLMTYMNQQADWHIQVCHMYDTYVGHCRCSLAHVLFIAVWHMCWSLQVQFGTVAEYFAAVDRERDTSSDVKEKFPVLQGDFMTYTDRDNQYWSGYYTSRPFLKYMVRHLQSHVRYES